MVQECERCGFDCSGLDTMTDPQPFDIVRQV